MQNGTGGCIVAILPQAGTQEAPRVAAVRMCHWQVLKGICSWTVGTTVFPSHFGVGGRAREGAMRMTACNSVLVVRDIGTDAERDTLVTGIVDNFPAAEWNTRHKGATGIVVVIC